MKKLFTVLLSVVLLAACTEDKLKVIHNNDRVTDLERRMLLNEQLDTAQSQMIQANEAAINSEAAARIAGDQDLQNLLNQETAARIAGDQAQADALAQEQQDRITADNTLQSLLNAERNARILGDLILAGLLGAERSARIAGDNNLAYQLAQESAARISGDNALSTLIAQEKAARIAGDNNLANLLAAAVFAQSIINGIVQVQIANINSKFPVINSQLSSLQSQVNQTNSDLNSLESQINSLNVSISSLQLQQQATEADVADIRSDIVNLQSQIDQYGVKVYKCDSPTSTERILKINNMFYGVMNRVTTESVQVITGSSSTTFTNPKLCVKDEKAKLPGGNGECPSSWTTVGGNSVTVPSNSTASKTVVTSVKMALEPINNGSYVTTDGGPACSFSVNNGVSTNLVQVQ